MSNTAHTISFDIEEYFHALSLREHFPQSDWDKIPSRLAVGMDQILSLLDRHKARATMFFLGWVAERHPALVRRCVDAGHEIASHGYEHKLLWEIGEQGFDSDLERTEQALVAAGATRPVGFRASTFTLTRRTWWAFDHLVRRGYRYDSSIHPVRHPTYGIPDFEPGISTVRVAAGAITEFPVLTRRMFGRNFPAGGGGYLRLLPYAFVRQSVERADRAGRPAMIYVHPWEFDPMQPRMPAKWSSSIRHYRNLDRTAERVEDLLKRFRFVPALELLGQAQSQAQGRP